MKLTEDILYRNSSQFKNWSFTPTQLAELRLKTNIQACERVKANVARQRAQRAAIALDGGASASDSDRGNTPGLENGNGNGNGNSNGGTPMRLDKEVDCLTVAEEMRLVDKFCETTIDLAKFIGLPSDVTATAVQFLRRFYLYNSPMTYDALIVSRTITFIACKTDNANPNLDEYVAKLRNVTRDQILAPEHLIVQALRYNFEVKHPFRGLKGAHLELGEIARGAYTPVAPDTRTSSELQREINALPPTTSGAITEKTTDIMTRLNNAYGFASNILKRTAQLTDAYFLFTPSQIMFASLLLADEPLTLFYLSTKIPTSSPLYTKLTTTLRACAALFSTHRSYTSSSSNLSSDEKEARDKQDKAEISALMKKLKQCRDPDKMDLVKLNQAQKRDAADASGALEESKAKRRKIARENAEKEADDFWGPELAKK